MGCLQGKFRRNSAQADDTRWQLSIRRQSLTVASTWAEMSTNGVAIGSTRKPTNIPLQTTPAVRRDGRRKVIRGGSWVPRGEFAARCANRAAYETNGESAQCRFPDCDLGGVLII